MRRNDEARQAIIDARHRGGTVARIARAQGVSSQWVSRVCIVAGLPAVMPLKLFDDIGRVVADCVRARKTLKRNASGGLTKVAPHVKLHKHEDER